MCEDEFIGSVKISQFKNAKTPDLPETYIPANYKFYGWTARKLSTVKATDVNFKEEYVGAGKMIHYMEVKDYVENQTVVMQALMIDKNDIPKVYHYVAIAWYDKVATSGIDSTKMETFTNALKSYLKSEGVSDEDLNSIVVRGYTGNVGPSCGAIMEDGDIDIMFGWGSADNVINTGGMSEDMLLETVSFEVDYNGTTKNRTIHRLTDSETVLKVMEWMKSDSCRNLFK